LEIGELDGIDSTPPVAALSTLAISSITPSKPSRPPSVTTNDGNPSRVISAPWNAPAAAPAIRPQITASHHGSPTFDAISPAITNAHTPAR
jgi:hypothetical protein